MSDGISDERIFELAKLHFGGRGHGLIWEDNAEYADAMDITLGTRWIVQEVHPAQTLAFARAILAAARPPTPVKTGPHDVEAVNAGMQQAAFDASRSVDGLGFKSLHHAGHKERDRWRAVVNAVTKIDRKTQAEGFWSDK